MSAESQTSSCNLVPWAGLPPHKKFQLYMKVTGLSTLVNSILELLKNYRPKEEDGTIRCFTFKEVYTLILRYLDVKQFELFEGFNRYLEIYLSNIHAYRRYHYYIDKKPKELFTPSSDKRALDNVTHDQIEDSTETIRLFLNSELLCNPFKKYTLYDPDSNDSDSGDPDNGDESDTERDYLFFDMLSDANNNSTTICRKRPHDPTELEYGNTEKNKTIFKKILANPSNMQLEEPLAYVAQELGLGTTLEELNRQYEYFKKTSAYTILNSVPNEMMLPIKGNNSYSYFPLSNLIRAILNNKDLKEYFVQKKYRQETYWKSSQRFQELERSEDPNTIFFYMVLHSDDVNLLRMKKSGGLLAMMARVINIPPSARSADCFNLITAADTVKHEHEILNLIMDEIEAIEEEGSYGRYRLKVVPVLILADMPATAKLTLINSHASHLCRFCTIYRKRLQNKKSSFWKSTILCGEQPDGVGEVANTAKNEAFIEWDHKFINPIPRLQQNINSRYSLILEPSHFLLENNSKTFLSESFEFFTKEKIAKVVKSLNSAQLCGRSPDVLDNMSAEEYGFATSAFIILCKADGLDPSLLRVNSGSSAHRNLNTDVVASNRTHHFRKLLGYYFYIELILSRPDILDFQVEMLGELPKLLFQEFADAYRDPWLSKIDIPESKMSLVQLPLHLLLHVKRQIEYVGAYHGLGSFPLERCFALVKHQTVACCQWRAAFRKKTGISSLSKYSDIERFQLPTLSCSLEVLDKLFAAWLEVYDKDNLEITNYENEWQCHLEFYNHLRLPSSFTLESGSYVLLEDRIVFVHFFVKSTKSDAESDAESNAESNAVTYKVLCQEIKAKYIEKWYLATNEVLGAQISRKGKAHLDNLVFLPAEKINGFFLSLDGNEVGCPCTTFLAREY